MANFITDDIDFSLYMDLTEHDNRVIPSGQYADEVVDYFWSEKIERGQVLPWERTVGKIAFRPAEVTIWSGFNGHGKALSLDTPIPTPMGWSRMGDLNVGDTVFDEAGKQCSVTWISETWTDRPTYRITFSDGTEIIADENHEWITYCARARHSARTARKNGRDVGRPLRKKGTDQRHKMHKPQIRTTKEIAETILFNWGGAAIANHSIPVGGPLCLESAELPIDPYVLGVWLGDGDSSGGGLTSADEEIVEAMRVAGITVTKRSGAYHYGLTGGLTTQLRACGLLNNKHIPGAYLRASEGQRLSLLKGLMDTDGHITNYGRCEFTSTNERLANGVLEVVRSLGIQARLISGRATLHGKDCGAKYRITFTPHVPVFALKRKLRHCKSDVAARARHRFILSCERVPPVPVRCIEVDSPSHLFLASEAMIPTHNSLALGQFCVGLIPQIKKMCIASFEMRPVITLARMNRQAFGGNKPDAEFIRDFHAMTDKRVWMYDQQGMVTPNKVIGVMNYCAKEKGIDHFIIDSFLKCGIDEEDYNGQKHFVDQVCTVARDTGMHVHLVAHSKKRDDESKPPRKMDVRGAGSITDQVDNVLIWWRNKPKEEALRSMKGTNGLDELMTQPDAVLICDKQRNGDWEGRCAFWFDPASLQFVENRDGHSMDMLACRNG